MKSKKIKSALFTALTLALVSATAVAVTWAAYLGGDLGDKKNTFTSHNSLGLGASEPNWTGAQTYTSSAGYKDPNGATSAGPDTVTNTAASGTNGDAVSKKYYEGAVIPKDPRLTNTSEKSATDEYVAMLVKFYVKVGDAWKQYQSYDQFKDCIATVQTGTSSPTPGFNIGAATAAQKWVASAKTDLYYYTSKLPQKYQTTNLFDSVKINALGTADAANDASAIEYSASDKKIIQGKDGNYSFVYNDGGTLKRAATDNKKLPQFKIEIYGYAVQADAFTQTSGGSTTKGPDLINNVDSVLGKNAAVKALEDMVS